MILLWFFVGIVIGTFIGFLVGVTLRYIKYDGIITMEETEHGLRYNLIVSDDPENLANQKDARFKIVSPSYDVPHSRR